MKRLLVTFFSLAIALMASAWGQKGHRVIANVAYMHLTKKAQKQVDYVLGKRGIIYLSTWPDEIKFDTIYQYSDDWHYQNMESNISDSVVTSLLSDYPAQGGRMYRKIDSLTQVLCSHKQDRDALVFIVHLTADRMCPVHMGHVGDRGGNRIQMKWFGQSTNLHSVWDSKLIESKGFSYSEYSTYLEDTYGGQKCTIEKMSWEELTVKTYHLTDEIYKYQQTWDGNAYHYAWHWTGSMEWQLYAAGVRLAQLLNQIYR